MSESTIDNGVCVSCDMPVTYDEAHPEWDEMCVRTKPYCTKSPDERMDWRASYKMVHALCAAANAENDSLRAQLSALTADRERMQPVYEAAKAWHFARQPGSHAYVCIAAIEDALYDAIDAALAATKGAGE